MDRNADPAHRCGNAAHQTGPAPCKEHLTASAATQAPGRDWSWIEPLKALALGNVPSHVAHHSHASVLIER